MEWTTVVFGFLAIGIAIYVPLKIELLKRPELRVEWANDANAEPQGVGQRIVHVKVINAPIRGRLGRWLIRNPANGCRVKLALKSRSDESVVGPFPAKWSAKPEPLQWIAHENGIHPFIDPEKIPDGLVYDLHPGREGSTLAVAIKRDGELEAYAFNPVIYASLPDAPLQAEEMKLLDTEYEVTVEAEAGGISCSERFTLRNEGDRHTGLSLTASSDAR